MASDTPTPVEALAALLAERPPIRCWKCGDRGFLEFDDGEYGSCREVVCGCGGGFYQLPTRREMGVDAPDFGPLLGSDGARG